MARKRKKNPGLGTVIGVVIAAGLGYFVYKEVFMKETAAAKPSKKAVEPAPIDKSMPKSIDFPMGWTEEDAGFETTEIGNLNYRVLKLNGPSDKCSPDPCTYVLVVNGLRKDNSGSIFGWSAHTTKDRTYEELVRAVDQMTKP